MSKNQINKFATMADFPAQATVGEFYFDMSTGKLYDDTYTEASAGGATLVAGDTIAGEDGTDNDLIVGQTTARSIFGGIVRPILENVPVALVKNIVGGIFDAFGIKGGVHGLVIDSTATVAVRTLHGIIEDNAGVPTFKSAIQFDYDPVTGACNTTIAIGNTSCNISQTADGDSYASFADLTAGVRLKRYANLAAITAAIVGTVPNDACVLVTGQGLATYKNGTGWVLAADDTTPIV